jgi:Txe/YoeB family toxin of Txe-Axe toxin-antitoxin module
VAFKSWDSYTDAFWKKTKNLIYKVIDDVTSDDYLIAYNLCLEENWDSSDLYEWSNLRYSRIIEDEEKLRLFLRFTKYTVSFERSFMEQFLEWKNSDFEQFKYLLLLMRDIQDNPFSGGMGQTENLSYRGKEASKRVTQEDRLSYTLEKNRVTFIACKGHYDFH